MNKKIIAFILLLIVTISAIPMIVEHVLTSMGLDNATYSTWIGFWGSYLGSLIGGIITLVVMYKTINENKKENYKNESIKHFHFMIKLVSEYCNLTGVNCTRITGAFCGRNTGREVTDSNNMLVLISVELGIHIEVNDTYKGVKEFANKVYELDSVLNKLNGDFEEWMRSRDPELRKKMENEMNNLTEVKLLELQNAVVAYVRANT